MARGNGRGRKGRCRGRGILAAKDAKSAKRRGKSGEYFVLNGMVIALVAK